MTISSRTPEGDSQRCPLCGTWTALERSAVSADAPCPSCGTLLWMSSRRTRKRASVRPSGLRRVLKAVLLACLLLATEALLFVGLFALDHRVLLFGLSAPETAILGFIGVILFGKKLPEAAHALGKRVTASRLR